MAGIIGTQPDVLREQREILKRQRQQLIQGHDGLCIVNGYLTCWCMKSCCWLWFDTVVSTGERIGERVGTCICRHCNCPDNRFHRTGKMRLA